MYDVPVFPFLATAVPKNSAFYSLFAIFSCTVLAKHVCLFLLLPCLRRGTWYCFPAARDCDCPLWVSNNTSVACGTISWLLLPVLMIATMTKQGKVVTRQQQKLCPSPRISVRITSCPKYPCDSHDVAPSL